jgi:uncharacterized phage-associated protein
MENEKPLDSLAVANWFIDTAWEEGQTITAMKVQKLVYFAYGWNLALYDSPLVNEKLVAYHWGPAFRDIRDSAIVYGSDNITSLLKNEFGVHPLIDKTDHRVPLLSRIWEVFGEYTPSQLSRMINKEDGPWYLTWSKEPERKNMNIDDELIKTLFKMM